MTDTALAKLQTMRSWLSWLPPQVFRPDASDVGTVAVMSHIYATALAPEPIFPEIGGAYHGSFAASPIEKMHQMYGFVGWHCAGHLRCSSLSAKANGRGFNPRRGYLLLYLLIFHGCRRPFIERRHAFSGGERSSFGALLTRRMYSASGKMLCFKPGA